MVSNRIALYRVEQGLSRKDLAAAVGVNPQTIGFLERGSYTPSVELALKLASTFNVSVEALFSLKPFPALSTQLKSVEQSPLEYPNVDPKPVVR
jgi:DNA-binding XRE family transcriptional regulator